MICIFPLLFSHSKNIRMSTLITIIITYYLLIIIIIITKSHNNYCSVGVMELCLLNLLILIDCFLCNSYPCVLFKSLSHVINQESHVYSWNLGKIYLVHFLKFWNVPRFTREISKFQKSELGKLIPNLPLKHVITSTNLEKLQKIFTKNAFSLLIFCIVVSCYLTVVFLRSTPQTLILIPKNGISVCFKNRLAFEVKLKATGMIFQKIIDLQIKNLR